MSRVVKWISQEKLIIDLKDYVSTGGNPTPDRITRIAKSLGVDDLFARISTTPIDYAFSTSSAINFRAETMRVKT